MSPHKSYAEKLKDPRWQKKRLEILERDNWTCQNCFSKTETLHVHHIVYEKQPWEIDDSHMVTLCECCHEKITVATKNLYISISYASLNSSGQEAKGEILRSIQVLDLFCKCRIDGSEIDAMTGKELISSIVDAVSMNGYNHGVRLS